MHSLIEYVVFINEGTKILSNYFSSSIKIWYNMGEMNSKLHRIKAILFDMHKTITEVNEGYITLMRKAAHAAGIDVTSYKDEEIIAAIERFDEWYKSYQIENDVDISYGNEVEHWTEANRMMFETLGIRGLSDEVLFSVEEEWRELLKTWERLRPDAKDTILELRNRGYQLGICTRRPDDPTYLLREWGILEKFTTVKWTSVPGYAKPLPYTLILAADELRVNPLRCVFVGNSVDSDILAAQRAGMTPILATWAHQQKVREVPKGTYIVEEVSELLDFFNGV